MAGKSTLVVAVVTVFLASAASALPECSSPVQGVKYMAADDKFLTTECNPNIHDDCGAPDYVIGGVEYFVIPGDNLDKIACDGSEPEGPQWDDMLTAVTGSTTFDQSGDVTGVVNPTGDDLDNDASFSDVNDAGADSQVSDNVTPSHVVDSDDSFMFTDAEDSAPWGTADEHGGDIVSFISGDVDQDSAFSDANDSGFDSSHSDGGVGEDGVNTLTVFTDGEDSTSMLGSDDEGGKGPK